MKKILLVPGLALLLLGASCNATEVQQPIPTVAAPVPSGEQTLESTQPNKQGGAPIGPAADDVYVATSPDGSTWTLIEEPIKEKASVPDLTLLHMNIGVLRAGELVGVFVDASEFEKNGDERIGIIVSSDAGNSWSEMSIIEIDGAEEHIPVDPSIVQLEDGRLRLYYYDFTNARYPNQKHIFYSAISSDGVNFEAEGEVFSDYGITDPDVVYFNEQWYLFYAYTASQEPQNIRVARSKYATGPFEELTKLETNTKGIPGAWVHADTLSLFGCGGGIIRSDSPDGTTWEVAETGILDGERFLCDPAAVQLEDGSWVMLVKSREILS